MNIYMMVSRMGSEDGFGVKMFEAGKHYEVRDTLGCAFIANGSAVDSKYAPMPEYAAEGI